MLSGEDVSISYHMRHEPIVIMAVTHLKFPYGVINVDRQRNVRRFVEKPLSSFLCSPGIYLFDRRILEYMPESGDVERTTFTNLAQRRLLKAYFFQGFFVTVNTIKGSQRCGRGTEKEAEAISSVLITGITGFIGSHLAEQLVERGYKVYGLARHSSSRDLRPIGGILDRIVLLTGDIADYASIHNALRASSPDIICHLTALTPVRYSFEHPFQYERDG